MDPTDAQVACFEAGIKFGSLYHQFAGSPLSLESAASLEAAMAAAIENQPHCESVEVTIDRAALETAIDETSADYVELTGRFLDVSMTIVYEEVVVRASMALVDGYPLMGVDDVEAT